MKLDKDIKYVFLFLKNLFYGWNEQENFGQTFKLKKKKSCKYKSSILFNSTNHYFEWLNKNIFHIPIFGNNAASVTEVIKSIFEINLKFTNLSSDCLEQCENLIFKS